MFKQRADGDGDSRHGAVPFSVADFFIYVIPGATFLLLVIAFEYRQFLAAFVVEGGHIHLPLFRSAANIGTRVLSKNDAVLTTALLLGGLNVAYVSGHLISSVSSLCIDRVLIFKGHEYPYAYLLRTEIDHLPRDYTQVYYRGMFLWGNIALILWYAVGTEPVKDSRVAQSLMISAVATIVLLLAATVIKVWADFGRDASASKLLDRMPRWRRRVVKSFSVAYDIAAALFADFTHSHSQLPKKVRDQFSDHLQRAFGVEPKAAGSESYWFAYIAIARHAPELYSKVLNWLYLYEFARNLATAFYLAALYCGLELVLNRSQMLAVDSVVALAPITLFALSIVMLGRYYYLYVCYYSKFIFRAFAFMGAEEEKQAHSAR